jgi:hypothetical protein
MNGHGLCAGCNCMAGNKVKGIYGTWIGIRNGCLSVGTKVGVLMTIALLSASGLRG